MFARDEVDVVVATIAFGMGIDKSNVRYVIHRDMPRNVEAWYQEIGRAGRDSLRSDCVIFYSWADVIQYDRFLEDIADDEMRSETRRKTVELFDILAHRSCRHQALVRHFDETIEACEKSCDICIGVGIESLVAPSPRRRRGTDLEGERIAPSPSGSAGGRGAAARFDEAAMSLEENARFTRLRALRKRLADGEGVPAYIVFSDAVLRQMAREVPKTRAALLGLSGIGPVKLERYGDAFLESLRDE